MLLVHTSECHIVRHAEELVTYLRKKGVDAKSPILDVDYRINKSRYIYENISGADYVLVVCNKKFNECGRANADGNYKY